VMTSSFRELARGSNPGSLSNRLRSRRFKAFADLVDRVPHRPVRILDVGGTTEFWRNRGWLMRDDIELVLLNLEAEPTAVGNIESVVGDATNVPYADNSFDIAFSNSTIEHLFTLDAQRAMARELRRVAARWWVQTPNFWFPVEPHFLTPAWHWLPIAVRVWLIQRRRFGWRGPAPDPASAERLVREIRLLRPIEMRRLFPGGQVKRERIGPLTKSLIAVRD
jgi:hypothetical protein